MAGARDRQHHPPRQKRSARGRQAKIHVFPSRSTRRRAEPKPPFPQHQPKPGLESKLRPRPQYTPPNYHSAAKLKDKADKPGEQATEHGKKVPMERPVQPEEVAPAFVFFASHIDSGYITGEVLTSLGGETTAA